MPNNPWDPGGGASDVYEKAPKFTPPKKGKKKPPKDKAPKGPIDDAAAQAEEERRKREKIAGEIGGWSTGKTRGKKKKKGKYDSKEGAF